MGGGLMLRCESCNKPQTFNKLERDYPKGYYADGADPPTYYCADCGDEIYEPLLGGLMNEEINRDYLREALEEVT